MYVAGARRVIHILPVTSAQWMRPGIGQNMSCSLGNCLTFRNEGHSWPRKLWFSIYSCTCICTMAITIITIHVHVHVYMYMYVYVRSTCACACTCTLIPSPSFLYHKHIPTSTTSPLPLPPHRHACMHTHIPPTLLRWLGAKEWPPRPLSAILKYSSVP